MRSYILTCIWGLCGCLQDVSVPAQWLAGVGIVGMVVSIFAAFVFFGFWVLITAKHPAVCGRWPALSRLPVAKNVHLGKPFWILSLVYA